MARKKETPKPMFGLKQEFYASLDHTLQMGINLISAVECVVRADGEMNDAMLTELTEQCAKFRAALMADE